ncbi:hypothetical protein D3C71_1176830 [compost metagenome]
MRHHQQCCAPARCAPLWGVQQCAGQAARLAQRPGAAGAGQIELGQIPVATRCVQRPLAGRVQSHALAQRALCQGRDRRLGAHHGRIVSVRGRILGELGTGQHHGGNGQGQHGHAVVGALPSQHHAGVFGGAQGAQLGAATLGGAGGEFRHDTRHAATSGFQGLQVVAQPGAVAHRHPHGFSGIGIRLDGKVQLRCVVEQAVFKQTLQHRPQARCLLARAQCQAGRQLHPLPGQRPGGHHGHHFAAGARGFGQQRGRGSGVAKGSVAVRRQRVAVLGGRPRTGRRQEKDEGAHGQVLRAILGGGLDSAGRTCGCVADVSDFSAAPPERPGRFRGQKHPVRATVW